MTFYRQGKELSYFEVIEMMDTLIRENILSQLEETEIIRLFQNVFKVTEQQVLKCLNDLGGKAVELEQSFLTLNQLWELSYMDTWNKAIEFYNNVKLGNINKEELVAFINEEYVEAMKELNSKIEKI